MWSWLCAFGLTMYHGVGWLFMTYAAPLLAGSLVGATLGSFRRWYAARWQIGSFAGLWISAQYAFIGSGWGTPWPFRNQQQVLWIAGGLGFAVAFTGSAVCAWWFRETESYWVRSFRDHPWRWTRWKTVRILSVVSATLLIPLWYVAYKDMLIYFHQGLPHYGPYQSAERLWEPYDVTLTGTLGEPLGIVVRTRRGLSPESLALIDESPCPVDGVQIFGSREIHDVDLIDAAPLFTKIKSIVLISSPLTDDCLPALAGCPQLRSLWIHGCPLITAQGVTKFHEQRPDVKVRWVNVRPMKLVSDEDEVLEWPRAE